MSPSNSLHELYTHPAVQEFGAALRRSLRRGDDFASITDLEFAETREAFAEAIKRFLRRYETLARKMELRRPPQEALEQLTGLVDTYGVKLVRAALISHALVEEEIQETSETQPIGGAS
ncbi:MAG: hypothetical protein C4316_08245 [Chloroflexota bacterium]